MLCVSVKHVDQTNGLACLVEVVILGDKKYKLHLITRKENLR